ncbi:hypothetical protein DevBK_05260 [Devosia sp. BK]|uniref:hypothetical protein n=1 Tax=unclassified Devosia TaxID=196773 RepID=UPI000A8D2974|nr:MULTISPECIES: hypothetical protein [unclassified Devosia]MDV3250738.1 hypothetical protein [Devosia sp. BK]
MSQDTMDLIKVLAAVLLVFAASTVVMLYIIYLMAQYGANLPMVGAVPLTAPPELIPLLAQNQVFATLAAVHVTATGIALALASNTLDTALLITAKAVTVVITSLIGFAGGHMIYLQLNENTPLSASGIAPALIALAGYFVLSTALSVPSLRQLGNLRFAVAVGLVLLGPLLLVWL